MKYIGMDLGTANTYIFAINKGSELPEPVLVPEASDASGSIATAVLYEAGRPFLAGNIAEAEYYTQAELRGQRRLAAQFKPEIGLAVPGALEAATDFLHLLMAGMPAGLFEPASILTVGVPALAREDFRLNLRDCFLKAGWPAPAFVRESDAALVSCLQAGALHTDDMARKCLILDFGGGTCDFSSVESLDILQSGGDALYGGRLFDDLFFQAFCRANPEFARESPESPYAWYAHWVECRQQKERFSEHLARSDGSISLRINWHNASGQKKEAYLQDYGKDSFLRDAENYRASPELLAMLAPYENRGGLSVQARDMLAGRAVGLISWLREMLLGVDKRREVARIILTGGSSRWFFVKELADEIFPAGQCVASRRGYEDIAFGLALFPALVAARDKAAKLLEEKLGAFTARAVAAANAIVGRQAERIASLCSERIVSRDVMPVLEEAQKSSMTVEDLEARFSANIAADRGLLEIAQEHSETLRLELGKELNLMFRRWLRENGVPLAPAFDFPAQAIGNDFFEGVSVRISRLESLNLMAFTIKNILPLLAATATAGAIAHSGEPVSAVVGGGAAFAGAWLAARAAPDFMKRRKLPSFILNDRNRKKIIASNREHIEKSLRDSFVDIKRQLGVEIEKRIRDSLAAMLANLTALNQVITK